MKSYHLILRVLYIVCLMLASSGLSAQELDTIPLKLVKSSYPIVAQTPDLQFIGQVQKWHYCYGVRSLYSPSFNTNTPQYFYANQISSNGYTISYLEKSGEIRLEYILLEKHKDFWIQIDGLKLCHKTLLDDVKAYFKYDDKAIGFGIAPLIIGKKIKNCPQYRIDFYTGETEPVKWHLVFNKKKQLIIIELDYNRFVFQQ